MLYFIQRSSSTGVSFLLRHCIFAIGPPISLFLAHNQHLEEQLLSLSDLSFSQKQMYRTERKLLQLLNDTWRSVALFMAIPYTSGRISWCAVMSNVSVSKRPRNLTQHEGFRRVECVSLRTPPCNLTPNVEGFRDPLCRMCQSVSKTLPSHGNHPFAKIIHCHDTTHPIKRTDFINKVMDRNSK